MEWRTVQGYEGIYRVNATGNVQSCHHGMWADLAFRPSTAGYMRVALHLNGKRKECQIHRLVALAFLKNPDNLSEVNHVNGDKADNRVENLEWITHCGNMQHAAANGLMADQRGENNGRATLTVEQVREMRIIYGRGGKTQTEVGKMFGVPPSQAHHILRYKQWTHI